MTEGKKLILDCGHNNDGCCEGVIIEAPHDKSQTAKLCHYCASEYFMDEELHRIVEWLKCQTRFGLPKFVISYLERGNHRYD